MANIQNYETFVKVAGLLMDTDAVANRVKVSAYNMYAACPSLSGAVIKEAKNRTGDQEIKIALDMVAAARAYNEDLLVDYADNDLAKHAGLRTWMEQTGNASADPEKIAMIGALLSAGRSMATGVMGNAGKLFHTAEVGSVVNGSLKKNTMSTLAPPAGLQG